MAVRGALSGDHPLPRMVLNDRHDGLNCRLLGLGALSGGHPLPRMVLNTPSATAHGTEYTIR